MAVVNETRLNATHRAPRVLFPFAGDSLGGSHFSAIELIDQLPTVGIEPVVVLEREGILSNHLHDRRITYELLPGGNGRLPNSRAQRLMLLIAGWHRHGKKYSADLVHTNDGRMHAPWLGASKLIGIDLIWHQRTSVKRRRLSRIACAASEIITISSFVRASLSDCAQSRAVTVRDPIVLSHRHDHEAARGYLEQLGVPTDRPLVMVLGHLTPQKRPEFAIRTLAALRQQFEVDVHFVFLGERREPATQVAQNEAARLAVNHYAHWPGMRTPIGHYLPAADAMLAPSVREGLGRNIIEAMIAGVPVVASDSGAHSEIIQHNINGLLFQPNDYVEAASYLSRTISQSTSLSTLLKNARKTSLHFSPVKHAEQISQLYARCLATRLTHDGRSAR